MALEYQRNLTLWWVGCVTECGAEFSIPEEFSIVELFSVTGELSITD